MTNPIAVRECPIHLSDQLMALLHNEEIFNFIDNESWRLEGDLRGGVDEKFGLLDVAGDPDYFWDNATFDTSDRPITNHRRAEIIAYATNASHLMAELTSGFWEEGEIHDLAQQLREVTKTDKPLSDTEIIIYCYA